MNITEEFSWTREAWTRISGALDSLHHGLLISGIPGIAKREFAFALAQLLLCARGEGGVACGKCRNCVLFSGGTHPDFHVLTTELEWRDGRIELAAQYCNRYHDVSAREKRAKPGKIISVDQVRLLIERFSTHAHSAPRKVAVLLPAERMNMNAANALLKLLEEPPDNSFFILVTASPGRLPATVRSRCMQIALSAPPAEAGEEWLRARIPAGDATLAPMLVEAAGGGPLDACKLHADGFPALQAQFLRDIAAMMQGKTAALEVAKKFLQRDFAEAAGWLQRFCCGLIRCNAGAAAPEWRGQLRLRAGQLSNARLFALYDKISFYRSIAREPLNEQLAIEELTLALQRALAQ